MFDINALKSFDWRSLKKFTSAQSAEDLNAFLESLPETVGQTMLIIAGVTWAAAGALGLFTTIQVQKLTELRAEFEEAEALKPLVPSIQDVAVNKNEVAQFVDKMAKVYDGISVKGSGASILISASSTAQFGRFREAVGHVQNGGSGWRVNIDRLCVGRECGKNPLEATLKINKVSVKRPG